MAVLPEGYTLCNSVSGVYDTGIVSQSGLEINALFFVREGIESGALFGARNSNSNTSAGQLYISTNYFGYRNARVSFPTLAGNSGFVHAYVNDNECEINDSVVIRTATGSQGEFTGTRNMYVNAYNNGGSQSGVLNGWIYGFVINKDGAKIADFIPCRRDSDSVYGLYDLVGQSFHAPLTASTTEMFSVSVQQADNGTAFLKTFHGEEIDELLSTDMVLPSEEVKDIRAVAIPDDGYEFEGWEVNGSVVSYDPVYDFGVQANRVLIPRFRKITSVKLNQSYFTRVLPYGETLVNGKYINLQVVSASIEESGIERTSSRIICESIPTSVVPGCFVQLCSPKNKTIYFGVVEAVEDNAMVCREILSYYDQDYVVGTGVLSQNYTVLYGIQWLLGYGTAYRNLAQISDDNSDYLMARRTEFMMNEPISYIGRLSLYHDELSNVVFPKFTETETQNLEDLILQLTSFGVFEKMLYADRTRNMMTIQSYYFKNNDTLSFGDNMENISNVQIIEENQESTIVQIYNSAGATLRGMYGMMNDGSIARYDTGSVVYDDFLGYTNYIGNVVLSDDNISTILAENLSSSFLNHKITFDLTFNDTLTFDKFKVGTPVEFYVGNRLFRSVITDVAYEILQNQEDIISATITLGNVRTSLTSKLKKEKRS